MAWPGLVPFNSTALSKPVDCLVTTTSRCMENGKGIAIRLNRSYRAIYSIQDDGFLEVVLVETVTKHEY